MNTYPSIYDDNWAEEMERISDAAHVPVNLNPYKEGDLLHSIANERRCTVIMVHGPYVDLDFGSHRIVTWHHAKVTRNYALC